MIPEFKFPKKNIKSHAGSFIYTFQRYLDAEDQIPQSSIKELSYDDEIKQVTKLSGKLMEKTKNIELI